MVANPWHPRIAAFFVYILGLLAGGVINEAFPAAQPAVYSVQVGLVVFLLWRYRKLVPELTIKFHWLAIPTGIGLLFAWVYLGYATNYLASLLYDTSLDGFGRWLVPENATTIAEGATREHQLRSEVFRGRENLGDAWYWTTMSLRLLGMSLVVPLFEELFTRSAVVRGTHSARKTWTGMVQVASDLPLIGDWVSHTAVGKRASVQPSMLTQQLKQTPVGMISLFSVAVSTAVFMLSHQRRDWAGCIACGVVWCLMLWWTNRPRKGQTWSDMPEGGRMGLGPIVWSHGITNAVLWIWTIHYSDWQFL